VGEMQAPSTEGQTPSEPPPIQPPWGYPPGVPRKPSVTGVSNGIAVELFGIAVALLGLASGHLSFGGGLTYEPNSAITGVGALIAFIGLVMHIARI
jgi:hypothetical protein